MTQDITHLKADLSALLERRSVSPKRLCPPGPERSEIGLMLKVAQRGPDHGRLHPWRVIEFRNEDREALADRFEEEKLRRDPLASTTDRRRAREHAVRAPVLLAFVVSPRSRGNVPFRDQWLAAGAALGNLLNAASQLGYGAIVLSGDRCFDPLLMSQVGVRAGEFLAGFVSIGSIAEPPPPARVGVPHQMWSCWAPEMARSAR